MLDLQKSTRISIKNVLYLTDFSKSAEAALQIVRGIATAFDANVYVLHVMLPDAYAGMALEMAPAVAEAQEQAAKTEMRRVESGFNGLAPRGVLVRAKAVWPAVEDMIKKHAIDLIIVGTSGKTGGTKLLLGSVAEEIFRRSPVPVMIAGPSAHAETANNGRFGCVLFATDLSSESRAAAPYAVSFAEENDANLILLHVAGTPAPHRGKSRKIPSIAEAMHLLEQLAPPEVAFWCRPQLLVEYGEPAECILDIARRRHADLIVLGVRSPTYPSVETHLGQSTAYRIVANAPCPVITVCFKAEARKLGEGPHAQRQGVAGKGVGNDH